MGSAYILSASRTGRYIFYPQVRHYVKGYSLLDYLRFFDYIRSTACLTVFLKESHFT